MKDDKRDYQTDDHRTQQPEFTIPVEDVQVQFYNLNVGENKGRSGGRQDASKYQDAVCYDPIKLFNEELALSDIPFAFDSDFDEMKIENVKKVTIIHIFFSEYQLSAYLVILCFILLVFKYFIGDYIDEFFQVGREMLYHNDLAIAFAFLLLNDVRQAFTVCKQIECNRFIKPEEKERFK